MLQHVICLSNWDTILLCTAISDMSRVQNPETETCTYQLAQFFELYCANVIEKYKTIRSVYANIKHMQINVHIYCI